MDDALPYDPVRLRHLAGEIITNVRELFSADATTEASRIVFGADGMIYMSLGRSQEGANAPSQDPNNYGGKLLRLRDDGTASGLCAKSCGHPFELRCAIDGARQGARA